MALFFVRHVDARFSTHAVLVPLMGSVIQVGCVALVAYYFDSVSGSRYRIWMHVLLASGFCLARCLPILPLFYLGAFLIGWCMFGFPIPGRVPLLITHPLARQALCQMWPHDSVHNAIDLGSGTGCMLRDWAQQHPFWQITGIESALFPYLYSRWKVRHSQRIEVLRQNFWQHPLAPYDVIYAFLSPEVMAGLWQCVTKQCRRGTTLVSFCFSVPDTAYTSIVAVPPDEHLFVYVVQ